MVSTLLNADDDWIEQVRQYWYPRLHPVLTNIPGPFYAVGHVASNQYVGTFDVGVETFEEILGDLGFERNPIACFKEDPHGHTSQGSWVLRSHDDEYGLLGDQRQLHVTVFNGNGGIEVFAHNEYDWQDRPLAHLRGKNFKPTLGRTQMESLLDTETYLNAVNPEQEQSVTSTQ